MCNVVRFFVLRSKTEAFADGDQLMSSFIPLQTQSGIIVILGVYMYEVPACGVAGRWHRISACRPYYLDFGLVHARS